ncbi:MAG: hypothetical protein LWY06_00765 [Firmicutes bacterium]|nr:hypothetical protein [Bacillota bacterium]
MPAIFKEYIETKLVEQKDEVRGFIATVVKPENLDLGVEIHDKYIRAIPKALSIFSKLVLDTAAREEIRSYFSLVIAYILEPDNFLRKNVPSMVGLLDNAYVLHSALEITINYLDENVKSEFAEDLELMKPIFEFNPIIKKFIPPHILNRQEVIIHYLEKLLDIKSSLRERPIFILPPMEKTE